MGNGPIRRRPWRRKPWGKKRPTRWNASTNGVAVGSFESLQTAVFPGDEAVAPLAIICDGQIDVEPWADEQEVTIDRVVGQVHFVWRSTSNDPGLRPISLLLKLGIVLNEELSAEVPAPTVNRHLFDQEDLEDTEWMWLHGHMLTPYHTPDSVTNGGSDYGVYTVDIDLRNRRKIGQRDELALYAAYVGMSASGAVVDSIEVNVQAYTDLRCILMSR